MKRRPGMKSGKSILKGFLNGKITRNEDWIISDVNFRNITGFKGEIASEAKIYTIRNSSILGIHHVNVIVIPDTLAENTNIIETKDATIYSTELIPVFIYIENEEKFRLKQVCKTSEIKNFRIIIEPQDTELEHFCCLLKALKKGIKNLKKDYSPEVWKMSDVQDKDLLFLRDHSSAFDVEYSQTLERYFHEILNLDEFSKKGMEVICNVGVDDQERLIINSCRNLNMLRISNAYMNDEGEVYLRNNALDYVFKPFYYNLLIDLNELQKSYNNSLELCSGDLIKMKLFNATDETNQSGNHLIEAKVCYAASNYSALSLRAEFLEKITDQSNPDDPFLKEEAKQKQYNAPTKTEKETVKKLQDVLNAITNNENKLSVWINEVGQANLILLYSDTNKFKYAVDYGIPRDDYIVDERMVKGIYGYPVNNNEVDYSYICDRDPKTVIITHWHTDHYNGIFLLNKRAMESVVVFAPNYIDYSVYRNSSNKEDNENLRLLINYLEKNDRIYCLGNFSSISNNNNSKVKISVTQNTHVDKSNWHGNGLLIYICGQTKNAILPGDCDYTDWPPYLKSNQFDFIVIPHHGSETSISDKQLKLIHKADSNAYVCTGINDYTGKDPNDDKTHPYSKLVSKWGQITDISIEYTNIEAFKTDYSVSEYRIPSYKMHDFTID